MHTLIIANGPLPGPAVYQAALDRAGLILCADGGANQALAASIAPDYVVGDLDSLAVTTRKQLQGRQLVHRPSQSATDLEKTLLFAIEKGAKSASVLGAGGERFDHQLTNLNILQKFSDRLEIELLDETGTGRFVHDSLTLKAAVGQQISLLAFRKAAGISTKGLKYPLKNEALEWGVRDGQSNQAVADRVEISVRDGVVFVFCVR